jgi:hypothetical protein
MPSKKLFYIGRKKPLSKQICKEIAPESETHKKACMKADRARHADARESESPQQTVSQLEADRQRHANAKASECLQHTKSRQHMDRVRHAAVRSSQTPQQTKARQLMDRVGHAAFRSSQTPKQTREQQQIDRVRRTIAISRPWVIMRNSGFNYDPKTKYEKHYFMIIGLMDNVCPHCSALKWSGETTGMCCSGGKVKLSQLNEPPEPLRSLMTGNTPQSKHFLDNTRKYNSCFQMTSFGVNEVRKSGYMPTFKIQGQICQRAGSLLPPHNEPPQFLQLYFMGDTPNEAKLRTSKIPGTKHDIIV